MERTERRQAQRGRSGGVLLTSTQIGLAIGLALVGCMTAFGGGFVIGMWYKATEQITPYAALLGQGTETPVRQSAETAAGPESPQTYSFYSTLQGNQKATAKEGQTAALTTPPEKNGKREPAVEPLKGKPPVESAKPAVTVEAAKPPEPPKPTPSAAPPKPAVEPPKPAQAVSPAPKQPLPSVAATAPETAPAVPSARPGRGDFTIQVGSFRSQEHAERLIRSLSQKGYPAYVRSVTIPGGGAWYRVRIGSFPDRAAADQTVQRLRAQEQVPAVVVSNY